MSRRPIPLMYINSPSAILPIPTQYEESTSIFVRNESTEKKESPIVDKEKEKTVEEKIETIAKDKIEKTVEEKQILPSVQNQLNKIRTPFGRHLYQPVRIKLKDQQIFFGKVEKIEEDVMILQLEEKDELMEIQTFEVLDILWRGKSIPEK